MADKPTEETQAAPKKSKKLLIIILAVVLLAGAGGGGFWFMKSKKAAQEQAGEEEEAPAAHAKKKAKIFVNLDPFTINLADKDTDRFGQVTMVLEVASNEIGEELKSQMPAVRNSILLLLTSKTSTQLLTVAGKETLAAEVAEQTGQHLGWHPPEEHGEDAEETDSKGKKTKRKAPKPKPNPVEAVHFAQFIVQ